MKIQLTKAQANLTIQALEWAQDDSMPDSSPNNMYYQRIINKIKKEIQK